MIFIYYAIKFIEAQGVKIQDPYHLKEALANKEMRFAEYIEKTSNVKFDSINNFTFQ